MTRVEEPRDLVSGSARHAFIRRRGRNLRHRADLRARGGRDDRVRHATFGYGRTVRLFRRRLERPVDGGVTAARELDTYLEDFSCDPGGRSSGRRSRTMICS